MDIETELAKYEQPIRELREKVSDVLKPQHSDEFLLRWLRTKHYDIKKAEANLRLCLKIRDTFHIDELIETYESPEIMMKHGILGFLGHDKEGTPIRYINEGCGDYDGFLRCFSIFDICVYSAYTIECDLQAARKYGEKIGKRVREELLVILDLGEFELQQMVHRHVIETGLDMMKIFQDMYTPEVIKRVVIINAPVYFSVAFNIFKPIMKASLIQKLEVHSRECSAEALLKYIDPEVLPAFLGGKRVDENGDPRCSAFIRQGGKIPECLYKKEAPFLTATMPGVKELLIPARGIKDHVIEVSEAGSVLRVMIESDNSIELCMLYKKKTPKGGLIDANSNVESVEEVICLQTRLQTHICPSDANIYCDRVGEYIFRFDNSFSWVTSKRILLKVKMLSSS